MGNLYVSDLDGTLLRSDEATSAYTNEVINSLVNKGMTFSYATGIIDSNDDDGVARWLEKHFEE